jgi:hypothetical protein
MEGMERMARNFVHMIEENIKTWEARSIEQSCVERVAWPDLFHVLLRMLSVMTKVIQGLEVYPDHMLQEIIEARGTYASDEAKNFLGEKFAERGIDANEAYRIVQLASFCAFEPEMFWSNLRQTRIESLAEADDLLMQALREPPQRPVSIQEIIRHGKLHAIKELEATEAQAESWNQVLLELFTNPAVVSKWNKIFKPSHLLKSEHVLFEQILG